MAPKNNAWTLIDRARQRNTKTMKVILTEDVAKLGGAHEVVDVAEGFARNYLMPRSLAVSATKSALANLDNERRIAERRSVRQRGEAEKVAAQLNGKVLLIPARIGTGGRLYGSIGTADIAQATQKSFGVELERKQIVLPDAIRNAGLYLVSLRLHRDVTAHITVQVGEAPAGGFGEAIDTNAAAKAESTAAAAPKVEATEEVEEVEVTVA